MRWSKLRRKEIKPMSKSEEYHLLGDLLVIEAIIYGTEVAEVLEKEKL